MGTKVIEMIKNLELLNLGKEFIVEFIPNDGGIYEKINQGVITFNEKEFNIYIFRGIFKKKFNGKTLKYKFSEIKDVDFGTYGFKHPYVKIIFEKDKYLVFSYYLKIKKFAEQEKNIKQFFDILGEIEVKI